MDVRLPDGTIIRGIPEGTTREQLRAKLEPKGYKFDDAPAAPAEDRGALEKAGEFAKGVGSTIQKVLRNTGLEAPRVKLPHGIPSLWGSTAPIEVPDTGYGTAGEIVGEIGVTLVPGAQASKAVMALPKVAARLAGNGFGRTAGRAALQGAAGGAAGSIMMGDNPLKGAAYGAVGGPLLTGAGKALEGTGGLLRSAARMLTDKVDDRLAREAKATFGDPLARSELGHSINSPADRNRVPEVIQALRRGTQPGPQPLGHQPTVGDFANDRLPELKAVQEFAAANPEGYRLGEVLRGNRQRMEMPLEQMVAPAIPGRGTQGGRVPLSPAEQARADVTGPLYKKADPQVLDLPPEIEDLVASVAKSPLVASPAREAAKVLRQGNMNREIADTPRYAGLTRSAPAVPARVSPMGMVLNPAQPAVPARASVAYLDQAKKEIDKRINQLTGTTNSADKAELAQLQQSRRELVGFMRDKSGDYAAATSEYARLSEPQDQGRLAQELLDALRGPGDARQTVETFLGAIENAPRTLQRADQSKAVEQLSQVMSPSQMNHIDQITSRVLQMAQYDALNAPQTSLPKFITDAGVVAENVPTSLSSRAINFALKQARRLRRISDEDVRRRISDLATNPSMLADLLERGPGRLDQTLEALRRRGAPVARNAVGGTMGTFAGQLADQE